MAGENEAAPESATIGEAAAMLDALGDEGETEQQEQGGQKPGEQARAVGEEAAEQGEEVGEPGEEQEEQAASEEEAEAGEGEEEGEQDEGEQQEEAAAVDAPEFWADEDKKVLAALPKDAQAAVAAIARKYETQRNAHIRAKEGEFAEQVKEARGVAEQVYAHVQKGVEWWKANGPQFRKNFGDRWAQVDWNDLAANNPAEWARLKQARDVEAAQLKEAEEQAKRDEQILEGRAKAALQEKKFAAHQVMAKELPQMFGGTPEAVKKTYDDLGAYLSKMNFSPERINAIHEPAIIRMAVQSMLYEQGEAAKAAAKAKASAVLGKTPASTPAKSATTTPTRVQPGPATRADNRNAAPGRQVRDRIRRSGGASIADAAELIRINAL